MVAPYMFGRPETITGQSFAQQADRAAPLATLPYAEALGRIQGIPMVGPGDAIYLRQAEGAGQLRGDMAAALAGNLANLKTRQTLQNLAAGEAQQSARLRSEQAALGRGAAAAGGIGAALGNLPGNLIKTLSGLDYKLREQTGEGFADLLKQQAADRAAARVPRSKYERVGPRKPVRLSAAYQDPSQASPEELEELKTLVAQKEGYEKSRLAGATLDELEDVMAAAAEGDPTAQRASVRMMDAAEEAMRLDKASREQRAWPEFGWSHRAQEGLGPLPRRGSGEGRFRRLYRPDLRDKAQEALERGDIDLYEAYVAAAEQAATEGIYGPARQKREQIERDALEGRGLPAFDEGRMLDVLDEAEKWRAQGAAGEPPADLPVEYRLDPSRYTGDAPVSQRGLFERGMVNQGMLEGYPGVERFEYAGPGLDYLPRNFQRATKLDSNLSLSELREILRSLGIK